jgi:hypothetical protein
VPEIGSADAGWRPRIDSDAGINTGAGAHAVSDECMRSGADQVAAVVTRSRLNLRSCGERSGITVEALFDVRWRAGTPGSY